MKKLLAITTLFFPALLFAQQKTGGLIKEHLYVKISPTLFAGTGPGEKDRNSNNCYIPAILGAVGAKIRYAALGFSAGYIDFKNAGAVFPWGADLTLTDFKRKKAFPAISVQWHQTNYTALYSLSRSGSEMFGKDMLSISAGVAFTVLKKSKILATIGISRLNYNEKSSSFNPVVGSAPYISYSQDHITRPFIAASWVL